MLREITHFFAIYKDLEGKRVEVKGWHDASQAREAISASMVRFQDAKKNVPEKTRTLAAL